MLSAVADILCTTQRSTLCRHTLDTTRVGRFDRAAKSATRTIASGGPIVSFRMGLDLICCTAVLEVESSRDTNGNNANFVLLYAAFTATAKLLGCDVVIIPIEHLSYIDPTLISRVHLRATYIQPTYHRLLSRPSSLKQLASPFVTVTRLPRLVSASSRVWLPSRSALRVVYFRASPC